MTAPRWVFISYARADGLDDARAARDAVEQQGFAPWMAPDSIPAGTDWDEQIDLALRDANAVVLILTPSALRSQQVKSEWQAAIAHGTPLIPLVRADVEIPRALRIRQWIDGRHELAPALSQLMAALVMLRAADAPAETSSRSGGQEHRCRVVGLAPLDITPVFKDRRAQRAQIETLLADDGARLISVIGRAGIGKSATVNTVLTKVQQRTTTAGLPAIDGIVYLESSSVRLRFTSLFQHCADLLESKEADRLTQLLHEASLPTRQKVTALLQALGNGHYVVVLDHIDPLLDADGRLLDVELDEFLDTLLRTPTRLQLLTTARIPMTLPPGKAHHERRVPMTDGLPPEDAIALLRDLDPHGEYGLSDASDGDLRRAAELTKGMPRALELIAGILASDVFRSLDGVLQGFYESEDVFEKLVEASYCYLDEEARRVLEILSVLGRPVPPEAISYVLAPFRPGLQVSVVVRRLVRAQMARVDRGDGTVSVHPIDREYALRHILTAGPQSLQVLHKRAALYYRQARGPRHETLFDIEPQQAELDHLLAAGELEAAALLLEEICEILNFRGQPRRLLEVATFLEPRVVSAAGRLAVASCLGYAYTMLGPLESAERHLECELELRVAAGDAQRAADASRRLGNILRYQLRVPEATKFFNRSRELLESAGDTKGADRLLYNLGLCAIAVGNVDTALDCSRRFSAAAAAALDSRLVGDAASLAGIISLQTGAVADAIEQFRLATEEYAKYEDRGGTPHNREIYALGSLGLAYLYASESELAIRYLVKAQERANRSGRARVDAFSSFNLVFAYLLDGQRAEALAAAKRTQTILSALGVPEQRAADVLMEAVEALRQNRPERASAAFMDAARSVQGNFDLVDVSLVEKNLPRLLRRWD